MRNLVLLAVLCTDTAAAFLLPSFKLLTGMAHGVQWPDQQQVCPTVHEQVAFEQVANHSMVYPAYYSQPFHGYVSGHLCWQAALELEAAEQAVFAMYQFPMVSVLAAGVPAAAGSGRLNGAQASALVRGTYRAMVVQYCREVTALMHSKTAVQPQHILDIGCGTGVSTQHLATAFPEAARIEGLDLSPYHLGVALAASDNLRASTAAAPLLIYTHGNAEDLEDHYSAGSFDLVSLSFVLHELPYATTSKLMAQVAHVLRPGGVLAVLDMAPTTTEPDNPVKSWLYRAVEPHFEQYRYWSSRTTERLQRCGFVQIQDRLDVLPQTRVLLAWKSGAAETDISKCAFPEPKGAFQTFKQQCRRVRRGTSALLPLNTLSDVCMVCLVSVATLQWAHVLYLVFTLH